MSRDVRVYAAIAGALVLLNFYTFVLAYPQTSVLNAGCCAPAGDLLAKDFSAFYVGGWRLFNDPSGIYFHGSVPSDPPILGPPERFKYMPSLLLLVSPLLLLPYQEALTAFDVFQFLLLPLMAILVFRLTRERGLLASCLLATVVLLLPSPVPGWGVSAAYFWQWEEGQSKVLETFLLLLSFDLGRTGRPSLSGIVFGLTFFDPRFALISVPLLLCYNRPHLRKFVGVAAVATVATNAPLLIPGVAAGFTGMLMGGGAATPLYYYAWIPLLSVLGLTAVEWRSILSLFNRKTAKSEAQGLSAPGGI